MRCYFILFLFCAPLLGGQFHIIHSMEEAFELTNIPEEEVLYVFDIDETLTFWEDLIQRGGNFNSKEGIALKNDWIQNCKYPDDHEYHKVLESITFLKTRHLLIEPSFLTLFQTLEQQGKKAIALTAFPSGPFGKIPRLEEWKKEMLLEMGLNFKSTSPLIDEVVQFHHFPQKKFGSPLYYHGVLFANDHSKGLALTAFLHHVKEHFGYTPPKIIFFDDVEHNLESVEEACNGLGISFKGYHYKGHSLLSNTIDLDLAKIQFDHLIEFEEWLRDEEALLKRASTSQ